MTRKYHNRPPIRMGVPAFIPFLIFCLGGCYHVSDPDQYYEWKDREPPELEWLSLQPVVGTLGFWEFRFRLRDFQGTDFEVGIDSSFKNEISENYWNSFQAGDDKNYTPLKRQAVQLNGDTILVQYNLGFLSGDRSVTLAAQDGDSNQTVQTKPVRLTTFYRCSGQGGSVNGPIPSGPTWLGDSRIVQSPTGEIWSKRNGFQNMFTQLDMVSLKWRYPDFIEGPTFSSKAISLAGDKQGLLWSCFKSDTTKPYELIRFDFHSIRSRHELPHTLVTESGDTLELDQPYVQSLAVDSTGQVWGLWGNQLVAQGYFRFEPGTESWHFHMDSKPNSLLIDRHFRIWKQSQEGILLLDTDAWKKPDTVWTEAGKILLDSDGELVYSGGVSGQKWIAESNGKWRAIGTGDIRFSPGDYTQRGEDSFWLKSDGFSSNKTHFKLDHGKMVQQIQLPVSGFESILFSKGDTLIAASGFQTCIFREEGLP